MSIKIIAGEFKGRNITVPGGLDIRPTASVVREALFNILGPWIEDLRVLDLFAGSGGIGFEALSRGARSVVFIDRMAEALAHIRKISDEFGLSERVQVIEANAAGKFSYKLPQDSQFDLIYIDPPYRLSKPEKILKKIMEDGLLAEEGLIVFEQEHKENPVEAVEGLVRGEIKKYGRTILVFFYRSEPVNTGRQVAPPL